MQKAGNREKRVLARRLALELSAAELGQVAGQGTSYAGTGGCDSSGRALDVEANDCTPENDTYTCP